MQQGKEGRNLRKQSRRRVRVRLEKREQPDVRKLGKALLALAMAQAQAEADAEAAHRARRPKEDSPRAA